MNRDAEIPVTSTVAPRLRRVQIKNYKSLASVAVDLEPFTVLIGPNGAGKSNFVDALRFVSECVSSSISLALQERGGINAVRRRSTGHPTHFGIRLDMTLAGGHAGEFSFEIAARPRGAFVVKREKCVVRPSFGQSHSYEVRAGTFTKPVKGIRPKIEPDRLALSVVSALPEFRPVYDFLTGMRFYSVAPEEVRKLQEPDPGLVLKRDGSNAASVLRELRSKSPELYDRVCRLLAKVVPGTSRVEYMVVGRQESLRFLQDVGQKSPWTFPALSMSDGTLRTLGILLATYQIPPPSLVGIEEPEETIHPAATEVVVDILLDGSKRGQVIITTHSPDILDHKSITDAQIKVVESIRGETIIAPLKETSKKAIRDKLYTPGELLKIGELEPDEEHARRQARQLDLFDFGE